MLDQMRARRKLCSSDRSVEKMQCSVEFNGTEERLAKYCDWEETRVESRRKVRCRVE